MCMHYNFLDSDDNLLYFVDQTTGDIKSVTTTGSNLTNILSTRSGNYGVVVNGDHMYCADYNEIIKVQKHPGGNSKILHTANGQIYGVFVYIENGNYCSYKIN